ncbi:hypothetical protein N7494_000419 [Penicillium frequentans]|uniref:Uncharacterized protein n=1 Tax=Penicillium frequentans TaxID=3151616 RepID=A0AAD6GIY6_9EURO|nr:hypothetical protein N7494_000419 [Penicillium glabrum]
MCHAIVWYHALCQHQDQSQTSTIPCFYATATGYDCLPHYQPILDIPLSGECYNCKGERKWQQMQRKNADKPLPVTADADMDEIANFDVDEIDLECHSQTPNDGYMHMWIGGTDMLATESHSDLDGWWANSWYEAHDESEEEIDLEGIEDLLPSLPCSEMEFGRDGCESDTEGDEFPDSPILGYAGSWDVILQQSQSKISKSKIPVPVNRQKLLGHVWEAYKLELFDQLTF